MVTAALPQLQVNGQFRRRMGRKRYFYRQIKEVRRENAPHKDIKGNVLVINLLFLDIYPSANIDVLYNLQSGVL